MTKKDKNADGTYNSRRPSKKRKLDQPAGVGLEDLDGDVKRPKGNIILIHIQYGK